LKNLIIFLATTLFAEIYITNGKINTFDFSTQQKNIKCFNALSPFDNKIHKYCGIKLKNFVNLSCNSPKKVEFIAFDDYHVEFNPKEINDNTIFLVNSDNGKKIIPKIVYSKQNYPKTYIYKKSIFLIKKAICK